MPPHVDCQSLLATFAAYSHANKIGKHISFAFKDGKSGKREISEVEDRRTCIAEDVQKSSVSAHVLFNFYEADSGVTLYRFAKLLEGKLCPA